MSTGIKIGQKHRVEVTEAIPKSTTFNSQNNIQNFVTGEPNTQRKISLYPSSRPHPEAIRTSEARHDVHKKLIRVPDGIAKV